LLARLDPGSVPELIAATRERSRPNVIPTGAGASLGPGAMVSDGDMPVAKAGLPVWLIMFSVVAVALFVAGLVVYLQRGDADAAGTPSKGSAVIGSGATPGSAQVTPIPPAGMILVKKTDGTAWFFVDAKPVSVAAFKAFFGKPGGGGDDPAIDIKFDEVRSYVSGKGGRLLSTDEYDAAARSPGFVPAANLAEFVRSDDPTKRLVRTPAGKVESRADGSQKDVTFRLAKDL